MQNNADSSAGRTAVSNAVLVQPSELTVYLANGGTGDGTSPDKAVGTLLAAVQKIPANGTGVIQLVGAEFTDTELKYGEDGFKDYATLGIIDQSVVTIRGDDKAPEGRTTFHARNVIILRAEGNVAVERFRTLNLENVIMDGTDMSPAAQDNPFIQVNKGILNLKDGSVIQNFHQKFSPVYLTTGYVYMYDGAEIRNNRMTRKYERPDNLTQFGPGRGGAVTITAGTFIMHGGSIHHNEVSDPTGKGSAVYLYANTNSTQWVPRMYMFGGEITNNSAKGGANGAVFVANRNKVNNSTGKTPGLFVGGSAYIANNTVPGGIGSVYLEQGMTMGIYQWSLNTDISIPTTPLVNGAKISVTAAVPARSVMLVTNVQNWQDADYFVMDTPQYGLLHNPLINALVMTVDSRIFLNPKAPANGNGSQASPYNTWEMAYANAPSGTTIMLMNDLKFDTPVELKGNKTLVLQGYDGIKNQNANKSVTCGGTGEIFHVSDENLALRNITLQGDGNETAPLLKLTASGAVTLGNDSTVQGGGAGGAQVDGGTLMLLSGSTVKNNQNAGYGGGIFVGPSGYLDLQGGTIKGNTATAAGGGVYAAGTVNLRGNVTIKDNSNTLGGVEIPDNLRLRTGKVVNVMDTLSGAIGVTADDPPLLGNVRVFAINGSLNDLAKFELDNRTDMNKVQIGNRLLMTNYSKEARLSTLKRVGVTSAGENSIVTMKDWGNTAQHPTDKEMLILEIPYAVKDTELTFMADAMVDEDEKNPGHSVHATTLKYNNGQASTGSLTFTVPYNAAAVSAGGKVTSFTIDGTAQDGVTKKQYEVTLERGYPKLTGNNTVNVTFDKDDGEDKILTGTIVVDALRGDSGIAADDFTIRAENAAATGAVLDYIEVSDINLATGTLTVEVKHKFLKGKDWMHAVDGTVKAGKVNLSLWIKNSYMGSFVVNALEVNNDLIALYQAVANYPDWDKAYPKEAYVRKVDKPPQGNFWGDVDLLEEDEFGEWEGTLLEQAAAVTTLLDSYAKDAADEVIKGLIKELGITTPPSYKLDVDPANTQYTHATNADPDYPDGIPGKYTFRVDVVLRKSDGKEGATLAGQTRTVSVIPKKYEGLTTDQLYKALQNKDGTGALDGVLPSTVWVKKDYSTDTINAEIYTALVANNSGIVNERLRGLTSDNQGISFMPDYPDDDTVRGTLVRNNGAYYILDVTVKAHSWNNPAAVTAKVEVRADVKLEYEMSEGQLLLDRAQHDILDALADGSLAIADIPPAPVMGPAELETLIKSQLQGGITTPAGTLLNANLIAVTLKKPLSELVTVELRPRSAGAFVPPINGTPSYPKGVNGQYAFAATLHTAYDDKPLSMPLPLASSGEVVVETAAGGSFSDNGVVLLPEEYKSSSGNDGSDSSDDSGGSTPKPSPTPTPVPSAVPTVKVPGGTAPPTSTPAPAPTPAPTVKPTVTPGVPLIPGSENVAISVMANQADGLGIRFADDQAVIRAVLTPEELKLIESGQKMEISLKVNKVLLESPDAVSADDRAIIKAEADKNKLSLGVYLDIKMEKRIGDGEWIAVTNLGEAISVSMDIPPELHKAGRIFSIARAHSGEVGILPNLSDDHKTIIFETDRFSTYAIIYSDTEFARDVQTVTSWFGSLFVGVGIGAAILAVCGLVLLLIKRRKKQ